MTGVSMIHVPYRGGAAMVTDLIGGQVQVGIDVLTGSLAHIRSGRLRALAVMAKSRAEALPDAPTIGDTVAGYVANSWCGLGVPRGTPTEIIERLKPRDQCWAGKPGGAGATRRGGDHADRFHARAIRRLYGCRGREVGQGGPTLRHPTGINGAPHATPACRSRASASAVAISPRPHELRRAIC
jgi:hypothetical protein